MAKTIAADPVASPSSPSVRLAAFDQAAIRKTIQITASQTNGADNHGKKEQVFALGPGALWSFNPNNHLFVNVYFEMDAQSRPEGERGSIRYVHHF